MRLQRWIEIDVICCLGERKGSKVFYYVSTKSANQGRFGRSAVNEYNHVDKQSILFLGTKIYGILCHTLVIVTQASFSLTHKTYGFEASFECYLI